jgi:GTP-binding protein
MIVKSVKFVISAVSKDNYPQDNLKQVVFSGRSNVGKSSFINSLLNNKSVARVSQTPGKTRLINFFLINEDFYFVDIPGYGYANVSKTQIDQFAIMIEEYLQYPLISLAVLLLDIRRIPNQDDLLMYNYFQSMGIKTLIVLTKADKLSNNQRYVQIKKIKKELRSFESDKIFAYSTKTKENHDEIWDEIMKAVINNYEK